MGNSVTVVNEQSSLTLCEVKVWGDPEPVQAGKKLIF